MRSLPNVLVIVTDQQRRDTVGAYGSRLCRTPHMDRLVAAGLRFARAYTPTGLCSPEEVQRGSNRRRAARGGRRDRARQWEYVWGS